jgi:hypothetical protein
MELQTESLADIADPWESAEDTAPAWWAYGREFPRWYVWRGVTGFCYARIPGVSPQRVLRAATPELLRDEILFTGAAYRSVALSRFPANSAFPAPCGPSPHCDLNRWR